MGKNREGKIRKSGGKGREKGREKRERKINVRLFTTDVSAKFKVT